MIQLESRPNPEKDLKTMRKVNTEIVTGMELPDEKYPFFKEEGS